MRSEIYRIELHALTSTHIDEVIRNEVLLEDLVGAFGSPLSLLIPTGLLDNVAAFEQQFTDHGVDGQVWYACKVNKSEALLEAANGARIGIDASSLWELRAALGHGFSGERIGISGPIKSDSLLLLASQHGCTICIDALPELDRLANILSSQSIDTPVPILVRLSGFDLSARGRSEPVEDVEVENGRFGIALESLDPLLDRLRSGTLATAVALKGFSFHLDNLTVRDRVSAFGRTLGAVLHAQSRGFPCNVIDAGGGFPVQYVRHEDWKAFHAKYVESLTAGEPIMFRNKSFGASPQRDQTWSRGNFYPHDAPHFGSSFLRAFLRGVVPEYGISVAELLGRYHLRLIVEPGRATIDQTGITACRVRGVKQSSKGDPLVVCDMNVFNLYEQLIGSEYTVDPILIPADKNDSDKEFSGYLAGNLCLETDMLSWRPVTFPRQPRRDDLLLFLNTAGYHMDFAESQAHLMPTPAKVALFKSGSRWRWKRDDRFSQLDLQDTEEPPRPEGNNTRWHKT